MVKVHKLVAAIATTFTLSTTGVYALNMGEISWKSSYGQPLSARIELSDSAGLSATDIKVSLATNAEFSKAGIDYSNELSKLIFTTIIGKNGKAYIQVTSKSPIKEPYLDFLVNVSYQGNKLSKDYTILMDLPAPSSNNRTAQSTKKMGSPITTAPTNTSDTYQTSRGDTLWSVAEKLHGANSAAKAATSIYKKNPKAFINGSANHLIAGYTLKVPTDKEVRAISIADANAFIQSTKTPTPNKVANTTKAVTSKTDINQKQAAQLENKLKTSEQQLNKARIENDELSTKLDQLQTEIAKLDEISKLKDEQIQSIQSKIAEQKVVSEAKSTPESKPTLEPQPVPEAKPTPEPQPVPESKPTPEPQPVPESKPTPEPQPVPEAKPTPEPQPVPESKPTPEPQPVPESKPTPEPQPIPEPIDDTLFLGLDTSTLIKIGGGVLLLLCVAALILRRKKATENETEIDLSHVMLNVPEEQTSEQEEVNQTTDITSNANNIDSPLANLEEESNFIDKADIYLAYNRYAEAKDLLLEALKTDPTNIDYRLKLLEVYAEQGDRASFESEAQELLLLNPLAQQKVDNLKTHYSILANIEENEQFLTKDETPITTDQDVFPLSEHVEFSKHTNEPAIIEETSAPADTTVFNFDTKLEEDPLEKANANFELDTIHEEPVADENPIFSTTEPDYDFNADSPVYEFGHEEPQIKETAKEENFKFDLGIGQETSMQEKQPEEKTASGWSSFADSFSQPSETAIPSVETQPTTDTADHLDEIIEKDQVTTKLELVHAYLEMNDNEGAQDLLNEILQEGNDVQKAEAQKLLASIDNSIGFTETPATVKVEQPLTISTATESIEQKSESISEPHIVDTTSTLSQDYAAPLDISTSAAELDLGFELSPEDEVSTKIELARAYIDMGDMSGAREILDEVLKEGNTDQKKQAEQLVSTLS